MWFPRLKHLWVDAGYGGDDKGKDWVEKKLGWSVYLVKRPRKPASKEVLMAWAEGFEERVWAIEGAANPFVCWWASELLEAVVDVPPSLTSQYRSRRSRKKNDAVDAQNAARGLLANPQRHPTLPLPNSAVCRP